MPEIAIIGMAGRFPGARNLEEFWDNLVAGLESISHFREEDLEVRERAAKSRDGNYVKARGILGDVDRFDAGFFGIFPKEAELIDPQHRIFLECCWEAFEDGGWDPAKYPGSIGVYAGCSPNTYLFNQYPTREALQDYLEGYQVENYATLLGSNTDFLATRVSYKFNLRGPSLTLHAGCTTSLLAICQACEGLLGYQCDMALAGGVSVTLPERRGYKYLEGGMVSPDGHCRAFDAEARGTVFGSGAGVVLLKRLDEALAHGDRVYGIVKGFAVNNDGAAKVGFTAPSVEGQAEVVALAQASAGVDADSIQYVEAHGTGTPMGDPIEVAALTRAFRTTTEARQFCGIGSVKTNVGHLDAASGVTGFIKTTLALHHGLIPATLHYRNPNPRMVLEESPFYVVDRLTEWKRGGQTRRAGVSSLGVGGTNAHVILEETPAQTPSPAGDGVAGSEPILVSARSEHALEEALTNLAVYFGKHPNVSIHDASYTLRQGRRHFEYRWAGLARDCGEAAALLLERPRSKRAFEGKALNSGPRVAFMFPGQGVELAGAAKNLYRSNSQFRGHMNRCGEILRTLIDADVTSLLIERDETSSLALMRTEIAQPALFAMEFCLARTWMDAGVLPTALIGHSVGEYVAACLAGVFTLEDGLRLIVERARLMQAAPAGAMLAVRLSETDLLPLLGEGLSMAAENAPQLCVASGPIEQIEELERRLADRKIASRRLATSRAFHSSMLDSIVDPFSSFASEIQYREPEIPYISCVTGDWISASEACDSNYWARHLRLPVRFSRGLQTLLEQDDPILLEVGPGQVLSTLARQRNVKDSSTVVIPGVPWESSDENSLLGPATRLWVGGVPVVWDVLIANGRRVSLPTYPFERKRHWVDSPLSAVPAEPSVPSEIEAVSQPSMTSSTVRPTPSATRIDQITRQLAVLFEELSGCDPSELDPSANFLDLGFDSLFLTQVAQSLEKQFGVKVTFRQLLDQMSCLETVAAYLDEKMPQPAALVEEDSQPSPGRPATATIAAESSPAARKSSAIETTELTGVSSVIERVMRDQMDAMAKLASDQLAVLRQAWGSAEPNRPSTAASAAVDRPLAKPAPAKFEAPATIPAAETTGEFKPFGPYKPIQRGVSGGLSEKQKAYLETFVTRYESRTAGSKRITAQYRSVLADPRVAAGFRSQWKEIVYPIVTTGSAGSILTDVDGNKYIDLLNGFGPTIFGHSPSFVTEAVEEQIRHGIEVGPQSPLAGEVAELVCELTGMDRATFCNTGSEAVIAALRVARTVTGRNKVVLFAGSYHGSFDEVLVKQSRRGGELRSQPIAPGIPVEKTENVIVLDYGTVESLEFIRLHSAELAAVLVEPVQSRHPNIQPREFLKQVRSITDGTGTALIFDEVVSGFRVHPGGVQALFEIRADLVTYGKVVGGGYPIGILAGKARFMDALDGGMWNYGDDSFPEVGVTFFAGTFVRHPVALAATRAVLRHIKKHGPALQLDLTRKADAFVAGLNRMLEEMEAPTRVANFGSYLYFSFPQDLRFAGLFYHHMRLKGIHLQEGFPCFVTTAHSNEELDRVTEAFRQSIQEMQDAELLPAPSRGSGVPPIRTEHPPTSEERDYPTTDPQMEVWLAAQMGVDANCAYNESVSVRLRGELDRRAVQSAFTAMVARHEALRSRFSPDGSTFRILAEIDSELTIRDLAGLSGEERALEIQHILEAEARTPFALTTLPAFRAQLICESPVSHILVFTAHHIVMDGWSTNVFFGELGQAYSAIVENIPLRLGAALPFGGYAQSEAASRDSEDKKTAEKFWLDQFSKPVEPLNLPTDYPRPPLRSYRGATVHVEIGSDVYRSVKKAGAKQGCTMFATLLAGFGILMHRITGQDDLVIGIPAAGQSLVDNGSLVGHCVNFLALRSTLADSASGAEYLKSAKRLLLDAYEHQVYTYGRLLQKLPLKRERGRQPLIEVQFNVERVGERVRFAGLDSAIEANPKAFVNDDLFLNIVDSGDGLICECDFNTDLFSEETIRTWLDVFGTVLKGVAADASKSLYEIPLLAEDESRKLLIDWNSTDSNYSRLCTTDELVERQAAKTPDAIAAICNGYSLTYRQLNERSNQLARQLRKLGVRPGVLTGVCLERSLDLLVSLLAVWKAGGAYVPLDPNYPAERLSMILEDTGAPVLLTEESVAAAHADSFAHSRGRIVCINSERSWMSQPAGNLDRLSKPEDLAYVIFTSGSTGRPKGVEIEQRSVVNLLESMREKPGLTQDDVLVAVTTFSFDIAALELFLPLITGARVVIATQAQAWDGSELLNLLRKSDATVLQATPATWRMLLEAGWTSQPKLKMMCGGEALPRELANRLLQQGPELWNLYGPTETTIWSSAVLVQAGSGPILVGGPISNTQFYLLDSRRQPVPTGVPGELWIGGDGLARGYFGRPDLTADRFIESPFRTGERIYSTGDLMRLVEGGKLEFLGRLDSQVKIRGFRIELGEIETVLGRDAGVRDAVVVAREDQSGDKRLVGYIVQDPESDSSRQQLVERMRARLERELPSYMHPSAILVLDSLPRTSNGKVDRKALPEPVEEARVLGRKFVAPATREEQILADIWKEVLRAEKVGVTDSIFELGGDSLLIFRITMLANKAGLSFSPKHVFQYRTIADLSKALRSGGFEAKENTGLSAGMAIIPVPRAERKRSRVN